MPVKFELRGFDEFRKKLERLSNNVEGLGGKQHVPFTKLFRDSFMQKYTDFDTMQQMLDAGGIEDAEEIKGEAWSAFVSAHTRFSGWEDMFRSAGEEWVKAKINA